MIKILKPIFDNFLKLLLTISWLLLKNGSQDVLDELILGEVYPKNKYISQNETYFLLKPSPLFMCQHFTPFVKLLNQ